MIKFLAILKDSYREAMDAKTVYILLVLALLIIVLTASISYTAAAPSQAFEQIVRSPDFGYVFPDRGQARVPVDLSEQVTYSVTNVRAVPGGYSLRLNTLPGGGGIRGPRFGPRGPVPQAGEAHDGFRFVVANWLQPSRGDLTFGRISGEFRRLTLPRDVTQAEQAAITTEQMQDFIRSQFITHVGASDATVTRLEEGSKGPTYAFDVTVKMSDSVRGWPHTTTLFFGSMEISKEFPLGRVLYFIEEDLINSFMAGFTILIGIIITGFFIPNMLRKGALDLLITKPISRPALLVYKYIGGLSYVFLVSAFTVGGMWLAVALRSGYWDPTFLLLIPIITFMFAILYSFSTLIAVLTRSAIASILLTLVFAALLFIVGKLKIQFDEYRAIAAAVREAAPGRIEQGGPPEAIIEVVDVLHAILPRYKDIDRLTTRLLAEGTLTPISRYGATAALGEYPSWGVSMGASLGFIVVMLALASWRFNTRDG